MPAAGPELLTATPAQLAEGPVWDVDRNVLWWVDITGGRVHRLESTGRDRIALEVAAPVGSLALSADGTPVVAVGQTLGALVGDGDWRPLVKVGATVIGGVLNDSGADPAGRLWIGVSTVEEREPIGRLCTVSPELEVTTALDALNIPNGIDWSPDGATMYFVDSPSRRVVAYPFHDGRLGAPRVLVQTGGDEGLPDGLTVDSAGGIWVAYWGGGCVRRFLPDGRPDTVIEIPAALVSSCAFGGPSLDELYITTAADAGARSVTGAGAVLRVRPGISGVAPRRFAWRR